ncbi:MAG: class I SAM-dependent methyltransferase [Planctomycetaceae bacterium]
MARTYLYNDTDSGRWVPPWLRAQRETRYRWAGEFVLGKRVLEVGCGNGAGTAGLYERGATEAVGVDVDAAAIERASKRFSQPGLRFLISSGSELPVDENSLDVVVSLETIEHVEDHQTLLAEFTRALAPGGLLLLSTPNRCVTNPATTIATRPANPLHVQEWNREELEVELGTAFNSIEWFGQTFHSSRMVQCLTQAGRFSRSWGVRGRQLTRLLRMPFEDPSCHAPQPWKSGREPEVLVVICSQPRSQSFAGAEAQHA